MYIPGLWRVYIHLWWMYCLCNPDIGGHGPCPSHGCLPTPEGLNIKYYLLFNWIRSVHFGLVITVTSEVFIKLLFWELKPMHAFTLIILGGGFNLVSSKFLKTAYFLSITILCVRPWYFLWLNPNHAREKLTEVVTR